MVTSVVVTESDDVLRRIKGLQPKREYVFDKIAGCKREGPTAGSRKNSGV
jgi:acetolactate synthase small subunit